MRLSHDPETDSAFIDVEEMRAVLAPEADGPRAGGAEA